MQELVETKTIERMKGICEELNRQTDELNQSLLNVEQLLNSLKLGVCGWSITVIGKNLDNQTGYKLGFCRLDKNWKLVCKKINLDAPDDDLCFNSKAKYSYGLLTPITMMPRWIRVEACHIVEEVINGLIKKAESYSSDLCCALNELGEAEKKIEEETGHETV